MILITGCARTGTSLFTYLMKGFYSLRVLDEKEQNPALYILNSHSPSNQVIKYPQGAISEWVDFGDPSQINIPAACNLSYFLNYTDWKVVVCVRDARDVLCSKHALKPNTYWVRPERWIVTVKRILPYLDHKQLQVVFYEELVKDPEIVMKKCARFLNQTYNYGWIEQFYKSVQSDTPMALALNGVRPIDTNSIGVWRKPEHKTRMEEINGHYLNQIQPLMEALGYDLSK